MINNPNGLLENINRHPRDKLISMDEPTHTYTIIDPSTNLPNPFKKYISVTTWVKGLFKEFDADEIIAKMMKSNKWNEQNKYWGMSVDDIKKDWEINRVDSSGKGTDLHKCIEDFFNGINPDPSWIAENPEWNYFLNYLNDSNQMLTPYRTEWRIFSEDLNIAGTIDMLYKTADGSYVICDWKRAKEIKTENKFQKCIHKTLLNIPDTNFHHYSIQLNIYKFILERHYNIKISSMFLIRLHRDAKNYECHVVRDMQKRLELLFQERLNLVKSH